MVPLPQKKLHLVVEVTTPSLSWIGRQMWNIWGLEKAVDPSHLTPTLHVSVVAVVLPVTAERLRVVCPGETEVYRI